MKSFIQVYEEKNKASLAKMSAFPWEDRRCYAAWLTQTYFFVRYSTRLLSMAAAFCKLDQNEMHKRMLSHLKEETGHEFLAHKDIEALGYKPEDFPELNEIRSFYQTQFYLIQNQGAHQLMGWIIYLEGMAAQCGRIAAEGTKVHGPNTTRFLRLHAEEDIGHVESAFTVLTTFTPEQMKDVTENYLYSADRYLSMLTWASQQKLQREISA